jgi:hypothetical protein
MKTRDRAYAGIDESGADHDCGDGEENGERRKDLESSEYNVFLYGWVGGVKWETFHCIGEEERERVRYL